MIRRTHIRALSLLAAIALPLWLAGCETLQRVPSAKSAPPLPAAWTATDSAGDATPADPTGWLADFASPELDALVAEAIGANPDLRVAAERVVRARTALTEAGADRLPTVDFGADASRKRSGWPHEGKPTVGYGVDVSASWELDLWGRLRELDAAAAADLEAESAAYHGARLSLAAAVTRAWLATTAADGQLALARQSLASFEQTQQVTESRYTQGIGEALDVRLGRASVAQAQSEVHSRQQTRQDTARALEILLGRYPGAAIPLPAGLPTLQWATPPAGLPAGLLARRPDLAAADYDLAAAEARLQAASVNRLPTVRLTGSAGTASERLLDLLDPANLAVALAAGLVQPVFDGGTLKARERAAVSTRDAALASYTSTLLTALREVESALANDALLAAEEGTRADTLREFEAAEVLARDAYARGIADITTLLSTQRQVVSARNTLLDVRRRRLQNRVSLYLALGGEFALPQPLADGAAPGTGDAAPGLPE